MVLPRYSTKSFSYTIPLHGEGKYLLVLKFCEVFFEAANRKVFDVLLNDVHSIVTDLDIYSQVGHATAHDEYIPFTISRGKLFLKEGGGVSEVRNGRLKVSFVKGQLDNPKINAIVLVKGADVNEFPRLPKLQPKVIKVGETKEQTSTTLRPLDQDEDQPVEDFYQFGGDNDEEHLAKTRDAGGEDANDDENNNDEVGERRIRRTSGPKQPDPYAAIEGSSSMIITIFFIVVATIIPIVILRCRL